MIGTYILNYMDKAAFTEASIFGIREHLVTTTCDFRYLKAVTLT
jgi:hypothetical protein